MITPLQVVVVVRASSERYSTKTHIVALLNLLHCSYAARRALPCATCSNNHQSVFPLYALRFSE